MAKRLLVVLLALAAIAAGQEYIRMTNTATVTRVEELTEQEQGDLTAARAKLQAATDEYSATERRIAAAHKMSGESWMEWSAWYQISGKFILYYYQSNMPTNYR